MKTSNFILLPIMEAEWKVREIRRRNRQPMHANPKPRDKGKGTGGLRPYHASDLFQMIAGFQYQKPF